MVYSLMYGRLERMNCYVITMENKLPLEWKESLEYKLDDAHKSYLSALNSKYPKRHWLTEEQWTEIHNDRIERLLTYLRNITIDLQTENYIKTPEEEAYARTYWEAYEKNCSEVNDDSDDHNSCDQDPDAVWIV